MLLCEQNLQVRGEAYEEVKALQKSKQQKSKSKQSSNNKKNKKKAAVLYEADDLGTAGGNDGGAAIVHMAGLGNTSATSRVKQQIRTMNMPLGKRTKLLQDEQSYISTQVANANGGVAKVTTKGGSKEVTYIPLDKRRKLEEAARKKQQEEEDDENYRRGKGKRQRRGIKDLGFKVPFKNKS